MTKKHLLNNKIMNNQNIIMNNNNNNNNNLLFRSIEVRYFCSDKSRSFIEDVKEPSSCNYSVNVNLRELCDFPLFQPKSTVKTVFCQLN